MNDGLTPHIIEVEIDISRGMKSFSLVGLPDKAVEEAKERISVAIKNSKLIPPQKGNQKTIVSLAPANLKKEGPIFDLAIAIAHLFATKQVRFTPDKKLFIGELGLSGETKPIRGALLIARKARECGFTELYLPMANASEAAFVEGIDVYGVANLAQLTSYLQFIHERETGSVDEKGITPPTKPSLSICRKKVTRLSQKTATTDMSEVRGQESAKRALLIAAAGRHNIALYGPPGTGKSMLAKAFVSILPPLSATEMLETTGIHSVAGTLRESESILTLPPLRSPHHTSSYVAIVGGGSSPYPGEITLAHNGVLFLDEFPEFERRVLESLRGPLEDKTITVSRAKKTTSFPANFILVATMNPCPCGNRGDDRKTCVCSQNAIANYERKLSGPITERIDLWIKVDRIDYEKLAGDSNGTPSATLLSQVTSARDLQSKRFYDKQYKTNNQLKPRDLNQFAPLSEVCRRLLNDAALKLDLSPRSYHKVIKVARTIADLDNESKIKESHVLEALTYRPPRKAV